MNKNIKHALSVKALLVATLLMSSTFSTHSGDAEGPSCSRSSSNELIKMPLLEGLTRRNRTQGGLFYLYPIDQGCHHVDEILSLNGEDRPTALKQIIKSAFPMEVSDLFQRLSILKERQDHIVKLLGILRVAPIIKDLFKDDPKQYELFQHYIEKSQQSLKELIKHAAVTQGMKETEELAVETKKMVTEFLVEVARAYPDVKDFDPQKTIKGVDQKIRLLNSAEEKKDFKDFLKVNQSADVKNFEDFFEKVGNAETALRQLELAVEILDRVNETLYEAYRGTAEFGGRQVPSVGVNEYAEEQEDKIKLVIQGGAQAETSEVLLLSAGTDKKVLEDYLERWGKTKKQMAELAYQPSKGKTAPWTGSDGKAKMPDLAGASSPFTQAVGVYDERQDFIGKKSTDTSGRTWEAYTYERGLEGKLKSTPIGKRDIDYFKSLSVEEQVLAGVRVEMKEILLRRIDELRTKHGIPLRKHK